MPEGKTGKNRLHLSCVVDTLDELDAEIARLQALGAAGAWEEEFPPCVAARYRNVILRDVEGNEFCLGAGNPASPRFSHQILTPTLTSRTGAFLTCGLARDNFGAPHVHRPFLTLAARQL